MLLIRWFLPDWKPLTQPEIERGLLILSWSRADPLATVSGLSREKLEQIYPGERSSLPRAERRKAISRPARRLLHFIRSDSQS